MHEVHESSASWLGQVVAGSGGVEPLVSGIEGRDADVDDAESSDGPVAASWSDQNCAEGADRNLLAVEFQATFAFEDQVDLRMFFMVMNLCVFADVHDVGCRGVVPGQRERPTSEAARTPHRFDIVEMGNDVVGHVTSLC